MGFLAWLEGRGVSEWVASSDWGYPLMLSLHSIGMAVVVGLLLVLDVRVLGLASRLPIGQLNRLMPVAWVGFGLNLISGVLLFMSTASRLVVNWPFLCKMIAILLAGAVSALLWRELRRSAVVTGDNAQDAFDGPITRRGRWLAIASIGVWLAAITFGRLIAYVMDAAILAGT